MRGAAAILAVLASLVVASYADDECGARNQPPCDGAAPCEEGLVEYTYTNSESETVTVCSPCGYWNRLPCTAKGTEPCSAGYAVDTKGLITTEGTCIDCGTNKRPVCTHDGEEPCENGYYEKDGYCYTCGIEGAAFCEGQNKCLPGYTPMLGDTEACTRCGYKDMPACANPNESPCSNGLGVNEDSGLCEYCGTAGKPGCETTCEPCRTGLALDGDGLCQYCGWGKKIWCTNQGEDICRNGLTPAEDGTCQACGSNGQHQCGIMGTHIAEKWDLGSSGEYFDLLKDAFYFKPVNDDQYIVTKENRGDAHLGDVASASTIESDITSPMIVNLDFDFPFYGTMYSSLCLSPQGHLVFTGTDVQVQDCALVENTAITLDTHYSAKRISFNFNSWVPECTSNGIGCIGAKQGSLTDGRKFMMVKLLNVVDETGWWQGSLEETWAQITVRIIDDGEIQMYTRAGRSRDGIMGLSPGYPPLSFEDVNFSGEFCKPGTTPIGDGTCAKCGGKNQPICRNSNADSPCKNNFVQETDVDDKKTGYCVRA